MEHSQISCDRVWEIDLDAVETRRRAELGATAPPQLDIPALWC